MRCGPSRRDSRTSIRCANAEWSWWSRGEDISPPGTSGRGARPGPRAGVVTTVSHPKHRGVETHAVETADDMLADLRVRLRGADALVMAAAVADFRPAHREGHKIRREETPHLALDLEPIPDLLAALAHGSQAHGVVMVGFAPD